MNKIELLAPAGDLEKLHAALRYGADAVYLGGTAFNLRAASQNFDETAMVHALDHAHVSGKRVYVTLNALARGADFAVLPSIITRLSALGVDGLIVADLGVLSLARRLTDVPIHISTQASVLNHESVAVLQGLGASRIILARELSLDEISFIRDKVRDIELEVFVHGAMCMSYSGRCHISAYLARRDGNRGACANPCRWRYALMEEKRPGVYFPVEEDHEGSYFFNSRDLCTIQFLDKVIATGVNSLKIEGRGKGLLYAATTTRVYRQALDACLCGTYACRPEWLAELQSYTHRGYTSGFFLGGLDPAANAPCGETWHPCLLIATVVRQIDDGCYLIRTRNQLRAGMALEALFPDREPQSFVAGQILDPGDGAPLAVVHPDRDALLKTTLSLSPGDLLRSRPGADAAM